MQVIQSQVTFGEFLSIWTRKHCSTLGAGTQSKYKVYVERYLRPSFGDFRLCDLETELLQGWLNRLHLGWWAKSDVRNILSSIFTKAADWGYWHERNPAERLTPGKNRREADADGFDALLSGGIRRRSRNHAAAGRLRRRSVAETRQYDLAVDDRGRDRQGRG